jgi:hypothetical protein
MATRGKTVHQESVAADPNEWSALGWTRPSARLRDFLILTTCYARIDGHVRPEELSRYLFSRRLRYFAVS